jgi:hypothetical protein
MALSTERDTKEREDVVNRYEQIPVATNVVIFQGGLVCTNASGYGTPGAVATTLIAVGRAEETVNNNPGSNGAKSVRVKRGVFKFKNSTAGDAIVQADLFKDVYVVDDETVAKTNGTNTRSVAGKCVGIDPDGVWVSIKPF